MSDIKKISTESPEFQQIEKELFFKGEETASLIESFCYSSDASIYASCRGDLVTGFCVTNAATSDVMHLRFIGTHKDFRKSGTASELIRFAISDQKPKAVVAEVPQHSIDFFTKFGFYAVDFGENEVGKNVYYATYRVK